MTTDAEQLRYRPGEETDYGYWPLLRPDGTEVTTLTEPEDRMWVRDLKPVIDELNALRDRLAELECDLAEAKGTSSAGTRAG